MEYTEQVNQKVDRMLARFDVAAGIKQLIRTCYTKMQGDEDEYDIDKILLENAPLSIWVDDLFDENNAPTELHKTIVNALMIL